MSVDYYSYVLVGVEVDPNKLWIPSRTRNCSCVVPYMDSFNYCPNCGKEVFRKDTIKKPELKETLNDAFPFGEEIVGCPVIYSTNRERAFIAYQVQEVKNGAIGIGEMDFQLCKKYMKDKLEPLGLWNENHFGIWGVSNCSY
jgi:hypothetical protein